MGRMRNSLFENRAASIGIGAMILFIAMVLIAGIAATVIIQTSSTLEQQAMNTGSETTSEVSAGLAICAIEGYAATNADISKLAILVRPRAGTESIDISGAFIEISDSDTKVILNYTSTYYSKPDGQNNIFAANVFPNYGGAGDATRFGILILEDADGSISSSTPVINRGDKVYLCINATGVFSGIAKRTNIWGMVVPEEGAPGVIQFTTPGTYASSVMELYWNM
jgi:flagellin FlaB